MFVCEVDWLYLFVIFVVEVQQKTSANDKSPMTLDAIQFDEQQYRSSNICAGASVFYTQLRNNTR